MLILTRKKDQRLILRKRDTGELIADVMICSIEHGSMVKVGITAGEEVQIVRAELLTGTKAGKERLWMDSVTPGDGMEAVIDGPLVRGECQHRQNEDHMICVECGRCCESFDETNTCSRCRADAPQCR